MVAQGSRVETFTEFVAKYEPRLREALMAACGGEAGREATADALEYAWTHWERVIGLENPVGYLYKVGRGKGRRATRRRQPILDPVDTSRIPDVEPKLPEALTKLSERQRNVVVLVHCFQWSQSEVGDLLGLSKSTVRNHLERGMETLRQVIGGAE